MRSFIFLVPVCFLAAQPQPPKPPATPAPAPQPTVTMSVENAAKPMPVVPPDKVVLTVGDISLTAAQFNAIIEALPQQYQAQARGAGRKQFADNIVHILVLSQEAKRRKLDESPNFKAQSMFQVSNMLAGAAFTQISKEVVVDEAPLRKAYDERKAEFEQVHARHILVRMQGSSVPVKPGQNDLTDAEALARAIELRKKLVEGADFATLATAESDDAVSAAKGGDLGNFGHGKMVPSFDQAAFAMKPGELSEPVKSQLGYHLILVVSHDTRSFEDVRAELERPLRPPLAQKALDELQKKSNVVLDPEFFNIAKQ